MRNNWGLWQGSRLAQYLASIGHRMVFETDGKRVKLIRAGRLPEVEYIEGCA